jgi:hypothetical protein
VKGIRKGFELIGLDGRKGLLSHADMQSLDDHIKGTSRAYQNG